MSKPTNDPMNGVITQIEKAMVRKPLVREIEVVDEFIDGYIEAMYDNGIITDIQKDFLQMMFSQKIL